MSKLNQQITDITNWAHTLLTEVLSGGDLAIDLTAGAGHDTLWLAQQVDSNSSGSVLAFDIQQQALDTTTERLRNAGFNVHQLSPHQPLATPGISLCHCCHSQLDRHLACGSDTSAPRQVQGVIANFGYLPGSDHTTTTMATSSCAAVEKTCHCLAVGGRIALVLYTGHSGALAECAAIEQLCANLDSRQWNVLRLQPVNRHNAPYLLVLEKRLATKHNSTTTS
jgi:hypothetical protein